MNTLFCRWMGWHQWLCKSVILLSACMFGALFAQHTKVEQCVRVGYGCVAPLHNQKLQLCGVKTVGILDVDLTKKEAVNREGMAFCTSYAEAMQLAPDFWDVCAPTDQHVAVIKSIIQLDPQAFILVEKPLCLYSQLPELTEALQHFQGKIVVNENYLSSQVTQRVKQVAFQELKLDLTQIVVEMDKNRIQDFRKGRYIDAEGALKYEGPHMLTILEALGEEFSPQGEIDILYDDVEIPERLPHQGIANISFRANNVLVHLFSSMKGNILHPYPPFFFSHIPEGDPTRYRVVAVHGLNVQGETISVVGFYEPLPNYKRGLGMVVVLRNGQFLRDPEMVEDDTIGKHLERAVNYFRGQEENPCPLEKGIHIVNVLDQLLPK